MSDKTNTLNVTILDRELRVACPEDEREALMDAVAYLNKKMIEIRDTGKIVNAERIAIMAALNISHELLTMKLGRGVDLGDFTRRMNSMQMAIDQALSEQDRLF
ncbi:MAG: cell division protein ZapA [Gallionella sp.]|nr:cell division protein ZapA [Gallionella sp.]MDD4947092.1 cell division protein ZapA [Gallionella sp.]MDD5611892.1 cell division protein ZapA [Gallionella sp.]